MNQKRKTILSLSLVSFLLAFNYFILKALKDSLLVTAQGAGAEAIPFVKMWLLFPISIVFLGAFTWTATRISLRFAVTGMISFFLSSYALFAFVLYPFRESLHLHAFADSLQLYLPAGWKGLVAVVRYWSYALFYVTAECWCTMIYSVVFWGYANAVTKLQDAQKYYPYLTLAGTTAALVAGPFAIFATGDLYGSWFPMEVERFTLTLYTLTGVVLFCGLSALFVFQKYCPDTPSYRAPDGKSIPFWSSLTSLFKSRYLLYLALAGISYNLVINLSDVVWKNEVLKLYPDPSDFTSYLSYVTLLTGIMSTFLTLFVCRQSLRRFGWTTTALITPMIALATGIVFFIAMIGSEKQLFFVALPTITFLGSLHICLSCAGKYTLFEPTKEMAFIPLSATEKLQGKAAIDGVGARVGKTGSSIIFQTLLMFLPTISACSPYVGVLLLVVLVTCINSITHLGKMIEQKETVSKA